MRSAFPTVYAPVLSSLLLIAASAAGAGTVAVRMQTPPAGSSIQSSPAGGRAAPTSAPTSGDARVGWPVDLHAPGAGFPYTPTLFDIDGDGADEIFVTGGNTFGLKGDGTSLPGWPTTEHQYMGYGTNDQKPGPSAADLEGDGDVEVVWSERDWWAGSSHMWCFNGREADGSNMTGFPQFAPDEYSNALDDPFVLGDSDDDGVLEAWGPHTLGNNATYYRLSAFDAQGDRLFTRDLNPGENILDLHFGDVDGDGHDEFFATAWLDPVLRLYVFTPTGGDAPGYPVTLGTFSGGYLMFGPPVPVDMEGDGDLEFLIGYNANTTSTAYARHHDGSPVAGYPITIATDSQLFYLGVGDLTGDGTPELLALDNYLPGTDRALAFNLATGAPLPGWPVFVDAWPHGFPCVADVDGDGRQDFCLSTDGGYVYAINAGGAILPGFPKTMSAPSICGVAAGDIDRDGLLELVSATWNGWVYAWDTTGPALPGRADWPMRGVDARNTGIYHRVDPAAVASPWRFVPRLEIAPDPAPGRAEFRLSGARDGTRIDLLDVLGRRVDTVTLSSGRALWVAGPDLPAGVYLARWQGGGSIVTSRLVVLR